ncbi:maleate cis-trans isomerase family protein [Candidatus Hodarchaeum mangrovi]
MRLGLLIPSSNTTMEAEFGRVIYKNEFDITLHISRLSLTSVDPTSLYNMKKELKPELQKLKDADVNFVIYGCTSGSLLEGKKFSDQIIQQINDYLGHGNRSSTTSQSVLNYLRILNVKKIVVITPYNDSINELEKNFLENNGYQVIKIKGMQLLQNLEIGRIQSKELLQYITQNLEDIRKVEALFISCTNLPTFKIISQLEDKLQIPVISSNSASLYEVLSQNNIYKPILKKFNKILDN